MTRRRKFEHIREEVEELDAQTDSALGEIAAADPPDELVELVKSAADKRLVGEELNEDEERIIRQWEAAEPV